jgi:hypothetical protein
VTDAAKAVLGIIAFFIVLVLIGVGLHLTGVYVFGGVQRSTADYRGETDQIEKTRADGSYRIQAYETFFDQCNAIAAKQQTVKQMEAELETTDDAQRKAWLQNTLTGIKSSLNTDISRYNADAAKEDTVGNFRASGLPYKIELDDKETQCSQ